MAECIGIADVPQFQILDGSDVNPRMSRLQTATTMQRTESLRAFFWTALLSAACTFGQPARAEVRLPKVFGSHMVMQQEKPLVVWGWATPNETVKVQLGTASAQAQANTSGEWKVGLPAMKAGGPYILKVSGSSNVQFEDMMIGEVWLCS